MKMLVVFQKSPRLRHIGHLDLMRAMQRALRRSDLPLKYSQGFNPHILLTFASPLSVGFSGEREVMEVPLERPVSENVFFDKLSATLPEGTPLVSVRAVDDAHPAPMARLTAASYRLLLSGDVEKIGKALPAFISRDAIPAMRKTKTGEKPCDLRPMIFDLRLMGDTMYATLAFNEKATCKPDLLLDALCAFADCARVSARVTRTQLLAEDVQGSFVPLEAV